MSWLFSRALVEAYSAENSWDGEPSAELNVMPTPAKFSRNDKTMEPLSLSRFGLTLQLLTADRGEELLTWYRAGFRAQTSAAPGATAGQTEQSKGLTAKSQGFGGKCFALLERSSQPTSMWKTLPGLFQEDSQEFSGTWPRWGLMQDGAVYQQEKWALRMNVKGCGLWLPTPTAHNAKEGNYPAERTRNTPTLSAVLGGKINPQFTEWMMGWPINHTDLKPLETANLRSWRQMHGDCYKCNN